MARPVQVTGNWNAQLSASVDVLANGDYGRAQPELGRPARVASAGARAAAHRWRGVGQQQPGRQHADVLVTAAARRQRAGISFTDTTYNHHHRRPRRPARAGTEPTATTSPSARTGAPARPVTWIGSGNRTAPSAAQQPGRQHADIYSDANQSASAPPATAWAPCQSELGVPWSATPRSAAWRSRPRSPGLRALRLRFELHGQHGQLYSGGGQCHVGKTTA